MTEEEVNERDDTGLKLVPSRGDSDNVCMGIRGKGRLDVTESKGWSRIGRGSSSRGERRSCWGCAAEALLVGCVSVEGFGKGLEGTTGEGAETEPRRSSTPSHCSKSQAAAVFIDILWGNVSSGLRRMCQGDV